MVIITVARLGAVGFRRLGQPAVVGEILAGILLGPSLLGRLFPDQLQQLFPEDSAGTLRMLGQLGLVLLMFEVGLEFDFQHIRRIGRTAAGVAVSGIVLPFVLGAVAAWLMHEVIAPETDRVGFILFLATTLSITAIPILGRIMIDLGLQRTPVGVLTISAAAVDDVLGWILLAAVSAVVSDSVSVSRIALQLVLLPAFVIGIFLIARPLLVWIFRSVTPTTATDENGRAAAGLLSVLMIAVFGAAILTNRLGVFAIFGPFVLGACLSDQAHIRALFQATTRGFSTVVLLPVFFTFTGLQTNIGLLNSMYLWGLCLVLLGVATAGKVIGCGAAARLGGLSWRESGIVAVMMNTRALMGLVAIHVGRDLGVVPDIAFSMLVLMAIGTTVLTMPILRRLLPKPVAGPVKSTTGG